MPLRNLPDLLTLSRPMEGVELLAAGTWQGNQKVTISTSDLDAIVDSFAFFDLAGKIPLKLGHDGDDPRDTEATQFAYGWVQKIWREGRKLLATLEVPDQVYDFVKQGFLRHVSVELLPNVQAANRVVPWVLDAVALLGADPPAVGALRGLQHALTSPRTGNRISLTRQESNPSHGDRSTMTSELDRLRDAVETEKVETAIARGDYAPNVRVIFKRMHNGRAQPGDAAAFLATQPPLPAHMRRGLDRPHALSGGSATNPSDETADRRFLCECEEIVALTYTKTGRRIEMWEASKILCTRNPTLAREYLEMPTTRWGETE